MNFFAVTRLERINPAQGGARGMRVVATGLLIVMAILYISLRLIEPQPAIFWGYVRAFAEAAMVGGLADWFAVTALFRHPLGLPIPHTAIIPRNKDRIGNTLAGFLKDNFLTASVVARRMNRINFAGALGNLLTAPPQGGRIREGAARLFSHVVESLADEKLAGMVKTMVSNRLRSLQVAPLLGQMLEGAVGAGRHLPLLDGIIRWAQRTLTANEGMIRDIVNQRAGAILRWTGLDEKLANAILDGLQKLLLEMETDPAHPMRAKAEEGLVSLAHGLRHDPKMQARVDQIRDELLANPAIAQWLDGLWQTGRTALLRIARDPDAAAAGKLGETLRELGRTLQTDRHLGTMINRFVRRATVGTVAAYGDGIVKLVSDTIHSWDARTVTDRLENAVGRDLQYIRINGTLVGGLVGVIIHAIGALL